MESILRPALVISPRARSAARAGVGVQAVLAWMALAIVAVATLAFWDEQRESKAALDDFGDEQASVATAVALALSTRLASLPQDQREALDSTPPAAILSALLPVENRGEVVPLLSLGDPTRLYTPEGQMVDAPAISTGLAAKRRWVRLDRPAAAAVGLPMRTAMARLASLDVDGKTWGVAVAATAQDMRDRERRAQLRLFLGVGVASGLVVAFGGLALRKQRKQLELARELAVADVERKRDERLVRADKLATMGALATGIAHEISTPLGVIVGRADQLTGKVSQDERDRRALQDIFEQAERITRIIRGFLTLARGDSPALEHVDAARVAGNAMALVEHRFAKSRVVLHGEVASTLPRIACEPRLFEQALANLLLNACDACAPGGLVELRVRADNERVAFVVTDDGEGIPPEIADRVAEPFFTTKPTGHGTGLGLAITNEIAKHHNGTLTIGPRSVVPAVRGSRASSPPGSRGTRACIEIPSVPEASHV